MLLNFSVENSLSFRQPQQFTMIRNGGVHADGIWQYPDVSPLAVIYGGNASGKSNFLRCLRFFSNFVANSFRSGDSSSGTGLIPFLLDDESKERPATFFAEFIAGDGNRYKYWFSLTQSRVVEEVLWLYKSTTNRKTILFEREAGKRTRFGTIIGARGKVIESITRENALLLSGAAASGIHTVQPVYDEITKAFIKHDTVNFDNRLGSMVHMLQQNPVLATEVANLVKYADLGITAVDFREENVPAEQEKKLLSALSAISGDDAKNDTDAAKDQSLPPSHLLIPHINFSHSGRGGVVKQFSEQWESDGTKNVMLLFLWVIQSLTKPSVMLVDEIDTSLSTKLLSDILDLYRDPHTNPHQSQLIFTTHDLSLISASGADTRLLDRDQIWFVTKEHSGESSLHPLTEWETRNVNFAKNYQHGLYGHVPQTSFHETVARICQENNLDGSGSDRVVDPGTGE